jgi:hypothetical protein
MKFIFFVYFFYENFSTFLKYYPPIFLNKFKLELQTKNEFEIYIVGYYLKKCQNFLLNLFDVLLIIFINLFIYVLFFKFKKIYLLNYLEFYF